MSTQGPQVLHSSFNSTLTTSYPAVGSPQIDLTSTGDDFHAQAVSLLNQDAAIVIYFSWDGTTDAGSIDPADSGSVTFDNFHPPGGMIYLKAASGTPTAQVHAWA